MKNNEIGIVICNYNKAEYIIKCVHSVFSSSFKDFDIYIVDNASEDNSVELLRQEFGSDVNIIVNEKNLGGSGGFNTGLRKVLDNKYNYIMMLDNDVEIAPDTIEYLYNYLKANEQVGIAGAKILKMDARNTIQEFGTFIDFDNFNVRFSYRGCEDTESIPDFVECDYIAACALMIKRSVLEKTELMPERNFIYWDDMELGYSVKQQGYKVVACGQAKVWHKGGSNIAVNTFYTYYWYRNKTKFFIKYAPQNQLGKYIEGMIDDIFKAIYACWYSGRINKAKTIIEAFIDALYDVCGKASDYKIRQVDTVVEAFKQYVSDKPYLILKDNGYYEQTVSVLRRLELYNCQKSVIILTENSGKFNDYLEKFNVQYANNIQIIDLPDSSEEKSFIEELVNPLHYDSRNVIEICSHIFDVDLSLNGSICADGWCNLIEDSKQWDKCINFSGNRELFYELYSDTVKNKIMAERN